jgi:hypothetical protein
MVGIFHGYVSHNQRLYPYIFPPIPGIAVVSLSYPQWLSVGLPSPFATVVRPPQMQENFEVDFEKKLAIGPHLVCQKISHCIPIVYPHYTPLYQHQQGIPFPFPQNQWFHRGVYKYFWDHSIGVFSSRRSTAYIAGCPWDK